MNVKMNILFLSYDGMTDPLGQSQVLPYLCGLSKEGYRFTLVSFEKTERFQNSKEDIERICETYDINWHPQVYHKSPSIISTIYDLMVMYSIVKKALYISNIKLIHCRSYLPALIAFMIKRKKNVKILFDMRGFWADERVDGKLWNLSNPVYKIIYSFFKRKENSFFNQADHVVSLTENGKKEILSWKSISNKISIDVIPCCVDTDFFDYNKISIESIKLNKKKLNIAEDSFVISYLGSIGTWYMLDEMLDFFVVLKSIKNNVTFLFITPDSESLIHEKCKDKNIDCKAVKVIKAKRSEVPILASISNFSIFFITPTYSKKASSPTKQGELMALGIPIICNDGVGDTSNIVRKYKSGIVVEELNREHFKESVLQLLDFSYSKEALRIGAIDYFSLEKGIQKYSSIYKKILS